MSTVEKIITYAALGEHDPGSAHDWKTSSELWRPAIYKNMSHNDIFNPILVDFLIPTDITTYLLILQQRTSEFYSSFKPSTP